VTTKREHADALTRREQEVAGLANDGLTNPEIAGRLFVSQKTVETHMSSILRKLGVSSRREIRRFDRS